MSRPLATTFAVLLAVLPANAQRRNQRKQQAAPKPTASLVQCTPTSIKVSGRTEQVSNPIARALERVRPGGKIVLGPGDYPGIGIGYDNTRDWSARTSGGKPGAPIVVDGQGRARIRGKEDAISVRQDRRNGHITFQNLDIIPGGRAGVMFTTSNAPHEGYRFRDVNILGEWNHLRDKGGSSSKWGVWGHSLKDFEFVGTRKPAVISDIRREHAFYILNTRGDVLIENVHGLRLGRTFCQFTARERNGPPGVGKIVVRNCRAEDVCIAAGDGYKGGSAFTVAGRVTGTILFENNVFRAGFNPQLAKLTRQGQPYGTGAFVAWSGNESVLNGRLILKDNDFEMAPGCGDRALVSIAACQKVEMTGNRFVAGASAALELERARGGNPAPPNGRVSLDAETEIVGPILKAGKEIARESVR